MNALLIVLLVTGIRAQYQCTCSCCLGQYCSPTSLGIVYVQNCSTELCLAQCRCSYPQCLSSYPYGQALAQCTSPFSTQYSCRCECCNTGSAGCTAIFIGYSTAYLCEPGACSIACRDQYPGQCISGQSGRTQGVCIGSMTTTTTSTTIAPWLGSICSCSYCLAGSSCPSNMLVGVTSASQCSLPDCTQACQYRYPLTCSSSTYSGQMNGVCLSQVSGNTKCRCKCCGGAQCIDYDININGSCTSCYTTCQQQSPCYNSYSVTYACSLNNAKISTNFYLSLIILTLMITLRFSVLIN